MIKVRMRDLALVAVAGGLLAFELVSIGEALPVVKQAIADRGWSGKALVASASAASVTAPAIEAAGSPVAQAVVGAAMGHAHRLAAATSSAKAKRCITVARSARRVHLVSVKSDGSCSAAAVALSTVKLREVQKAVDLALKQATL
jgi:hypothetical protein